MRRALLGGLLMLALWPTGARAQETSGPEIHGFLRPDWVIQSVDDTSRDAIRAYHFLTRSRLYLAGTHEGVRYRIELGFTGPEAEIPVSRAGFWGMPQILQDFYADVPFPGMENTYVRVGQFKIPAGAEGLTYSADLPFVERSIVHRFLGVLRDYGAALHTYPSDNLSFALAIQTGLGRSIPNRYLPTKFGVPLVTARVQFGPNAGHDLFRLKPALTAETMEYRVGANVTYYKDFLAGHSTALRVWNKEKPILLQSGWNPFIDARDSEGHLIPGTLLLGGGDVGVGIPAGNGALWLEGQGTYGQYKNDAGEITLTGARVQLTYTMDNVDAGIRYAYVALDEDMAPDTTGVSKVGKDPVQEISPMVAYRLLPNVKIILDGSILMDVPVAIEPGTGVYVLTDHPEEIGMDAVERQTVINLRAALQIEF